MARRIQAEQPQAQSTVLDNGEEAYEPGYKVKVVDPIGSGDAFSAGFMHKILRKANLWEACTYGNILGALATTKPGATYPISPGHIDEFKSAEYDPIYFISKSSQMLCI